jgi:hypothetical protein
MRSDAATKLPVTQPHPAGTGNRAISRSGQSGKGVRPHSVVFRLRDGNRISFAEVIHVDSIGLPRSHGSHCRDDGYG